LKDGKTNEKRKKFGNQEEKRLEQYVLPPALLVRIFSGP
jgi:hypothetical protein